jgi:hypothetical protein
MKSRNELHQELRQRILALSDVTERQNAGIHEDAFFVGGKMFMHIHGHGHCDIRLAKNDQGRILAEGKARSHRWAPEKGYVTFMARTENDLAPAMELIRMSHDHFGKET